MKSYISTRRDNLVTLPVLPGQLVPCNGEKMKMSCCTRTPSQGVRAGRSHAFTLVEMLAVAAIISILLALTVPVVGAFTSTAGRKGAVNILMNTLEQARVAALESGRDVHVIFWRREFPEKDAVMVVREPETGSSADPYELLTRWIEMPKGVIFYEGKKNGILDGKSVGNFLVTRLPKKQEPSGLYDVLTFNGSGVISYPGPSKTGLMLFVSEGVRGTGGTEAIIANRKDQVGGFEIISLRRFTGRASLEVSTLPGA